MLNISEHFYSIQGEGVSVGVPAYFIRLQGCNLMCGGPGGALVKEGKASWWCDSEVIWRGGKQTSFDALIDDWADQQILGEILDGTIHLVWTGGEPTLPRHQTAIVEFWEHCYERFGNPALAMFNEVETNGTIPLTDEFLSCMDQINCSPKLGNSGMSKAMRIKPEVLKQINDHDLGTFKFVVSEEADFKEIKGDFIEPFDLNETNVCIMPGVDNREDLPERTRFIFEMSKKYGYRAITRQHILAWDKVTGV